ncbi:hypothetical protein [Metabacillus fastidiosus]|uniref:hypothetical protein n=1 Tax=Metabacillus fastidiosus TaxID=1458 RepID=UPI003D2C8577
MFGKFKESPLEKINKEILNQFLLTEAINNCYKLGSAHTLSELTNYIDNCIENGSEDEINIHEVRKMIVDFAATDEKLNEYYKRLKEDEEV